MIRLLLILALTHAASAATLTLKPDADLQGDAAPRVAIRPFTVRVELAKAGTQGVLAAQGGRCSSAMARSVL